MFGAIMQLSTVLGVWATQTTAAGCLTDPLGCLGDLGAADPWGRQALLTLCFAGFMWALSVYRGSEEGTSDPSIEATALALALGCALVGTPGLCAPRAPGPNADAALFGCLRVFGAHTPPGKPDMSPVAHAGRAPGAGGGWSWRRPGAPGGTRGTP